MDKTRFSLNKAWGYLNGNKTIICLSIATVLQQAVSAGIMNETGGVKFAIGLSLALGSGSLAHHIKKGYFSKSKGN